MTNFWKWVDKCNANAEKRATTRGKHTGENNKTQKGKMTRTLKTKIRHFRSPAHASGLECCIWKTFCEAEVRVMDAPPAPPNGEEPVMAPKCCARALTGRAGTDADADDASGKRLSAAWCLGDTRTPPLTGALACGMGDMSKLAAAAADDAAAACDAIGMDAEDAVGTAAEALAAAEAEARDMGAAKTPGEVKPGAGAGVRTRDRLAGDGTANTCGCCCCCGCCCLRFSMPALTGLS